MTRKLKFLISSLFVMGWFFIVAPSAHAEDEVTNQVDTATVTTGGTIQLTDTSTATILTPSDIISSANFAIDQAETRTAQIKVDAVAITSTTETITATIAAADNSIILAQQAVENATVAITQVDSATALVADAEENIDIAQIAVDSQTAVVEDKIAVVESATAIVDANTTPGLNVTIYSNPGTGASPTMGGTVVYTGTDINGINEQWGSGGPTVNSGSTTITETFNNNQLNTTIGITVNGAPVSTTNNNNVYIGSIGFPGPGQDPSLSLRQPTATTTITMPAGTTSAGFEMFAKNGNTTGLITYSDGTTETYLLQDNVSSAYPNYVHRETFTAPVGKTISTVTIPTDWDYFAIDNVSATKPNTSVVTEDFQVKWEGIWTPQYTGTQYITASADDGVRLYLDNELVIDDWFDKGGGGSTADIITTAGVSKQFKMWYYENGGGAAVSLLRYSNNLGWGVIPGTEFSTSTATTQQIQTLQLAQNNLNIAQAALDLLDEDLNVAQSDLAEAEQNLVDAQNNLNAAVEAIGPAITSMNTSVTAAQNIVVQKLASEEAERARIAEEARQAELARQAAIAAENARIAAQQAYEAEQARIAAEAEAKAAAEAAAKAESDRLAAEAEAAAKAEADRVAAEEAAKKAEAEAAKAESDRLAAEAKAAAKAEAEAKALAEQKAKEAKIAKAEADKLAAEEAAKKAEADSLAKAAEDAKSGKELTEEQKEMVIENLLENIKPGESLSAEEIKESGINYSELPPTTPIDVRTDENGNAVIITASVAANLELLADPGALLAEAFSDPGAALAALGSIGADMSPEEREEATDMVVATVVAAGAAMNAVGAATAGGTTSGGSSGGGGGGSSGGSSKGSAGSRRNERW